MAAHHTKKLWALGTKFRAKIWAKTGGACWYCGTQTNPWIDFCADHYDNNGSNDLENLVPSCRTCNLKKRDKTIEEFRLSMTKSRVLKGFTKTQILQLEQAGIDLSPLSNTPSYSFWFETNHTEKQGE